MTESSPTALLVEDEPQIRCFVRTAMESEGWHVVESETLKQGLIDAGTRKPDLVVLDLGRPTATASISSTACAAGRRLR